MKQYKSYWTKFVQKNLEGYERVGTYDPFENWNSLIHHDGKCEMALVRAIELLSGDMPISFATPHLKYCVSVAERAHQEKSYLKAKKNGFFPINRGILSRAECYAKWFLKGELDRDLILIAVGDLMKWCSSLNAAEWEEDTQENYLSAFSMLLMIQDRDRLQNYLSNWRECGGRRLQASVIKSTAINFLRDMPCESNQSKFELCFDRIRRPTKAETIGAFEMAVLKCMFYEKIEMNDWPMRAIEFMSA